jgi:glyoxylase-like metal-dependent hydrolase (beta-lactamase superfamily II)
MFTRDVAPGIHRVEDAFTNWYLVEDGDALTIVDCGVPRSWLSLQAALRELGRGHDAVEAVVLTHAHFDHLGFAERARTRLGVPVYCHENDIPLARHPLQYTHERSRVRTYASNPKALPVLWSLTRGGAFFSPAVRTLQRYGTNGSLPVPGSPQVVFTPGHTLGHCALHFPDREALIAGDAVVTFNPYTAQTGPQLVSGAATADRERNLQSLDALGATGAGVVLCGHGEPWREGAAACVERARAAGPS